LFGNWFVVKDFTEIHTCPNEFIEAGISTNAILMLPAFVFHSGGIASHSCAAFTLFN
jgi:hypothetical protein